MTDKESYIRWQNIRITQFGFANNLIIGLSIAQVGYIVNFIQSDNLVLNCFQKILFWFGGGLSLVSIALGIFVVFNRLEDFRLTAKIAKNRESDIIESLETDRKKSMKLGKKSWNTFIWQTSTFIIGFLLLLIIILIELKSIIT